MDKLNRHPDENLGNQPFAPSIQSDIQELKRIMQSMKERSRCDRPNDGFNPSYRQNIPNERNSYDTYKYSRYDSQNRFPQMSDRNGSNFPTELRQNDWQNRMRNNQRND